MLPSPWESQSFLNRYDPSWFGSIDSYPLLKAEALSAVRSIGGLTIGR